MSRHAAHGWNQPGASGAERLNEPRPEDFDALADLFLGPGESPARAAAPASGHTPEPASRLAVELLVLGHLPVRAPLWARQYAWMLAQCAPHPVALVRLAAGTLQVEVLSPGMEPDEPLADAAGALRQAFAEAGCVLLRVDEPDEPRLARWEGATTLTLLSGVDDAAVVAAYRAIKSLGPGEPEDGPDVRIAWMGCEPEAARDAMAKLERACQTFLQRPLGFAGSSARIDGAQGRVLYRGPMPAGARIEDLLSIAQCEGAAARDAGARERAPARPVIDPARPSVLRLANPTDDVLDDDEGWGDSAVPSPSCPASRPAPRPAPATEAAPAQPESLASLMPGLVPLPARCPDVPQVELAADAQGGLHMFALDALGGAEALAACRAWAARHGALLALACPGLSAGSCRHTAEHLVTLDAPSAAHLVHAPFHLHLGVRTPQGWVLAPLNRPTGG
ncbi:MAG: hypothetical protein IT439_06000 [Phycisphaerales bacterium]|nr:hypothetical protein [Phycisphaerales bacterium]